MRIFLISFACLLIGGLARARESRSRIRKVPSRVVNSILLKEQAHIAQTCYWLDSGDITWDPRTEIKLSPAGQTQLARDTYDSALMLIAAAHEVARDYQGNAVGAMKRVETSCDPEDFVGALRELARESPNGDPDTKMLYECGEALSSLAAGSPPDSTEPLDKLIQSLEQELPPGQTLADLLGRPRALGRAFDFSPRLMELMVRLSQAAHEKIEGSAINRLPFGSGAAKWLIEMIIGDLLGVVMDYQLYLLERSEVVSRADVARRACELLEEAQPRPVITNRMLIRTILRFVEPREQPEPRPRPRRRRTDSDLSSRTTCEHYPGFCRRMARRLGIRHPVSGRRLSTRDLQEGLEPVFGHLGLQDPGPGLDEDTTSSALTRARKNGGVLIQATGSCATKSSCTMDEINRAMSMLAVSDVASLSDGDIVPDIFEREDDCCCDPRTPATESVELRPADPSVIGVLLDRSSSMNVGTPTKWARLSTAVEELTNRLSSETDTISRPRLQLGVFPIVDTRCDVGDLHGVDSQQEVRSWLHDVRPPRNSGADLTPLAQAIDRAAASLRFEKDPALIVVTDGQGNCGNGSREQVKAAITAAREAGVPVYVIGIGLRSHRWQHRIWLEMAEAGGTREHISAVDMKADPKRVAVAMDAAMRARRCRVAVREEPDAIVIGDREITGYGTYRPTSSGGEIQLAADVCAEFLRPGVHSTIRYGS